MRPDESPNIDWATRLFPPRTHVALALAARSSRECMHSIWSWLLSSGKNGSGYCCAMPRSPAAVCEWFFGLLSLHTTCFGALVTCTFPAAPSE